jgi:hypothetical protein
VLLQCEVERRRDPRWSQGSDIRTPVRLLRVTRGFPLIVCRLAGASGRIYGGFHVRFGSRSGHWLIEDHRPGRAPSDPCASYRRMPSSALPLMSPFLRSFFLVGLRDSRQSARFSGEIAQSGQTPISPFPPTAVVGRTASTSPKQTCWRARHLRPSGGQPGIQETSSSSNFLACRRSCVSNPSVNQP